MPPFLRKQRSTTDGAETRPSSSKKQRFIDAAKALLDIANESADAFPPLKSCLGGINALVKHYEESKDVEDKLGDLVIWLTKLKNSVVTTSTDDDHEEARRREQLTRSLEGIEKRSRTLLDKGKGARILDKRKDSGTVVKLVEELRQATLIYQLSQQRSIDNQVTQLASSFSTFLKMGEKAPETKEKTESTLARLSRLTLEDSSVRDEGESKRKMILFEALEMIKDRLQFILERSSTAGYQENDADAHAVGELAEGVRDAVIEYQFAQQNATYEQSCRSIEFAELSVLNNCRRAQAAEYRHGNRRGCLKGTRGSVLNEIESWAEDFSKSPVFWLNGLAGTGKSTIAQTISERLFAEGRLGASFFCSRDFEDRSDLHFIFPTLAFQLAHKHPDFRSHVVSLLRSNPDVVHESLSSQMQKLIVEPLRKTGVSTVIVIDALDECKDDEPSSAILSVLGRFVEEIPEVKFFITGRPETRIKTGFRLPLLVDSTDVFVLHDVHPSLIESDIRNFLKHELSELAKRRKLEGWPMDEHVDLLCERAAGLFVYAVATLRFLDSSTRLPKHRLDIILELPESTAPEGKTRLNPRTTLDSLYTSILQAAFSEEDSEVDSKVRTIVGTIVMVVNPLPPSAIAELHDLDPEEVLLHLELIQSLLPLGEDPDQPVKPFHKSFPDFIIDPSRCDTRFWVSPGCLHSEIATNCLRLMNEELEQDLLSLPEYALNSEIEDLQARIDSRISIALQYACRSWHNHLSETRGDIIDVIPSLRIFLEENFLAWLEVLSVLGGAGSASVALEKLVHWLQEVARDCQLLDTARDCSQFVTKFFEPINVSATHVYHSALEMCPISSIVRKLYYNQCHGITRFPRVVIGIPDSWDLTASFSGKDDYKFCTWSPCGRFVAVLTERSVEIRNQLTFEVLIVLQSTKNTPIHLPMGPLAYSPDGRSLACGFPNAIVIWDIQTGGVVKEIECRRRILSLVWSLDAGTIATTLGCERLILGVETYEVASGGRLFVERFESGVVHHLWPCEQSFQFITVEWSNGDPTCEISIFEIGPTPIKIKSYSVMTGMKLPSFSTFIFSPSTYRVSIPGSDTLCILDIRNSACLLRATGDFSSLRFSSDGSLFAAFYRDGIRIWNYSDTSSSYAVQGNYLFRRLPFSYRDKPSLQFSPTSSSFLSWGGKVLHMRQLHDPHTPKTRRQYTAISHSGRRVATAHKSESILTFIDLHSRTPSWFIDTGVEIGGLIVTGNVLLVASAGAVMAWLFTGEGTMDVFVGDKRAGRHRDAIWTIPSSSRGCMSWYLRVAGQIGMIKTDDIRPFIYHTETGEVLEDVHQPQQSNNRWVAFRQLPDRQEYHNLRLPNTPQVNIPPENDWLIVNTTIREAGWVVDPQGKHRFWLPVEWRKHWKRENWHNDISTLSSNGNQPVIVKF